jgi:hypothetical protein
MPDKRHHRGPNPEDARSFAPCWHGALRAAVADLSWLLGRGYASPSALKIVGDRYGLTARQRTAVMRSACTDAARADRLAREIPADQLAGGTILIDGYNVLTTIEVALSGGVLLWARDTTLRDIASIHGTYRKVEETVPSLHLVGQTLAELRVARATWYLDQPVSNSGRLRAIMTDVAARDRWPWDVLIVPNPDAVLSAAREQTIASADSVVLDACGPWTNLAREAVARKVPGADVIDLRGDAAA